MKILFLAFFALLSGLREFPALLRHAFPRALQLDFGCSVHSLPRMSLSTRKASRGVY